MHTVLQRLEQEVSKPESLLNEPDSSGNEDVGQILSGCQKPVSLLDRLVERYNALSEEERSTRTLWQRVKFGNGEVADVRDIRAKISNYTSALTLYLNIVSTGSMGRIEKHMEHAGDDLRDVKRAVNKITAQLMSDSHNESSILTTRTDEDKAVWKEFCRSLVRDGFRSSFLHEHKALIRAYFEELGERGILDEPVTREEIPTTSARPSEHEHVQTLSSGAPIQIRQLMPGDGHALHQPRESSDIPLPRTNRRA